MAENKSLKKALHAMALGSKSGFKTFYKGTAAFIYSSARLLYPSHEDACRFMVDVYQYIYLHLPEYDEKQSIEKWISRMIYDRYTQLSIGKDPVAPSVSQQMEAGTVILDENERARIWRMLDVHIHFPPEPVRRTPLLRIALIASVALLALLFILRYAPTAMQQLTSSGQEASDPATDASPGADNGADNAASGAAIDEDTLPAPTPTDNISSPDTQSPDDTSDPDTQSQDDETISDQMVELEERMNQINTPDDTPASTSQSGSDNSIDALEDLELNLRYGDSLIYADGNTDAE